MEPFVLLVGLMSSAVAVAQRQPWLALAILGWTAVFAYTLRRVRRWDD